MGSGAAEERTDPAGLRRALTVLALGSSVVIWNMWTVGRPALETADVPAAHQRLTPLDPPRFQGGEWVDEDGRPLEEARD